MGGQEEQLVDNFAMSTISRKNKRGRVRSEDILNGKYLNLIRDVLSNQWGLKIFINPPSDMKYDTHQDTNYVTTTNRRDYCEAWVLNGAKLAPLYDNPKSRRQIHREHQFTACLVFGAGSNVSDGRTENGSMERTKNTRACGSYEFFEDAIKYALRAQFDAGIKFGGLVFVVAKICCGIYAGSHAETINNVYTSLVQDVLDEQVGPNDEARWQYMYHAVIGDIM